MDRVEKAAQRLTRALDALEAVTSARMKLGSLSDDTTSQADIEERLKSVEALLDRALGEIEPALKHREEGSQRPSS